MMQKLVAVVHGCEEEVNSTSQDVTSISLSGIW